MWSVIALDVAPQIPTRPASGPSKRAKPGTSPLEIAPKASRSLSSCPRTSAVTPAIELRQQPVHRLIVSAQRVSPLQRLPRGGALAQPVQYGSIDTHASGQLGPMPDA